KAKIWSIGTLQTSFFFRNRDSDREIMVAISRDSRATRPGFNRRSGRCNTRSDRWRNGCVCAVAFAIIRYRLAACLRSLTVSGMRPMVAMRMTKRPQKSTNRTGFDRIAQAQKPDDDRRQKEPG